MEPTTPPPNAAPAPAGEVQTSTTPSPVLTPGSAAPAASPTPPDSGGSWRATLPPDLQNDPSIVKYNDVPSLAKSHRELVKKLGEPRLPKPQDNWTEKEYGELWDALGRPKDAAGYEFQAPKDLPEGMAYTPEQDKWFADTAHKLGIDKARATALREQFMGFQMEQAKQAATAKAEAAANNQKGLEQLRMQYGPKWDQVYDAAEKVAAQFGGDDLASLLKDTGLVGNPKMIAFMIKVGSVLTDHSVITGIPRLSGSFTGSASTAASELERLKGDKEFMNALNTGSHPKHEGALRRYQDLIEAAFPRKTA